jgi:hypothetical protein
VSHDHPDEVEMGNGDEEADSNTTPLYGGAILIFDEYGRVKYWVQNDVFGRRQKKRLEYLWNEGILQPARGGTRLRATRLSAIHRLRALDAQTSHTRGW